MMNSTEIRGRFLPSRVYSRWKWAVRLGLLLVPFLLFLAGGLILFLTPNQFRSTTLFSLENAPSPREIVELVHSRSLLARVVDQLELAKRLDVDKETALKSLEASTITNIVPETRMIELTVTRPNKVNARDMAEGVPKALQACLVADSENETAEKARQFDQLIQEASDTAEEKATHLANLEKVHGAEPAEPGSSSVLQRARRNSLLADAEVERLRNLRSDCFASGIATQPRLNIHSEPVIADSPDEPETGEELNQLTVRSLIAGLVSALLLPYLMELAFPPRRRPVPEPNPVIDL